MAKTVNVGAFYVVINASRERRGMSWRGVARELGLSPSVFTRLSGGQLPNAQTTCALAEWAGLDLRKVMEDKKSTEVLSPRRTADIAARLADRPDITTIEEAMRNA